MKTIEARYSATRKRYQPSLRGSDFHSRRKSTVEKQREEFLALLAHELLTPLTCILGWSQLAIDQRDPQLIREAFTVIERNARRQKALIDELLGVIHYTRGSSLTFNPREIDLWQQIEQYSGPSPRKSNQQLSLPLDPLN